MLLVIDVGNTHTVMGVFDGSRLVRDWRLRTARDTTEDEFNVLVSSLFAQDQIRPEGIEGTIISSVVPTVVPILDSFCRKYLGRPPVWVDPAAYSGMPNLYRNPAEVGADRIVNAVAAFHRYQQSLIIIDFGTATTFDSISEKGEYLGGAISPGIIIASEALFREASRLPRVEILKRPNAAVGKDTAGSIQSGIIYGYAALVDGMVKRIAEEMGTDPKVIATGGLAPLMQDVCESIETVEPQLTLDGLRIIAGEL
jgi:type III pantothenate kinase